MRTGHLAVDELDVARAALRDQTGQSDLGGVPPEAEHRFAEKHPAELYAVQPARQLPRFVGFDGVSESQAVQLLVGGDHVVVQPSIGPGAPRSRTGADGGAEGVIDPGRIRTVTQRLSQAARALELLRKQHHAWIRRPPEYGLLR